jgi:hypothetical protein
LLRSPQVLDREKFPFESDVYAVGMLPYQIIEERIASIGNNPIHTMTRQVKDGKRPDRNKATKDRA